MACWTHDEPARLEALHAYDVLDTAPENMFDEMVRIAAAIVGAPIALISLLDADREWIKARVGISLEQMEREKGFCAHAVTRSGALVIPDARQDPRFADSPWVKGDLQIRFYAAVPLVNAEGYALGTLAVFDRAPRTISMQQEHALLLLGRHVMAQLEERRRLARFNRTRHQRSQDLRQLRRALTENQFELHYQPKVDLRDVRLRGLEALIRWRHPDRGLVAPAEFIPVLEESGLILEVGRWVMQQATRQYSEWRSRGLDPPRIAVNVSPSQLLHPDFLAEVGRAAASQPRGQAPIDIELTESVFMDRLPECVPKLHGVRQLGVRVAIDDFGTGYSALAYLARLPIDYLKVDRVFVSVMTENPNDMAIVSSIISLAHGLDLNVIAEGVETVEQRKLLQLLRCDQMQGNLFSPAVPADQVEELLMAQAAFATATVPTLKEGE